MKKTEFALPAFAFIESSGHDGDTLAGRNVILHVRSASVVEIFESDDVTLNPGVVSFDFINNNSFSVKERLTIALHYSATLDSRDKELIKNEVLIPAARWFCDYCDWEDQNIEL
jgi:hypothetical protein